MANELIKKHKFEKDKEKIRQNLDSLPSPVTLNSFPTKGSILPCNKHSVTGSEINSSLVEPLQKTLIRQNTSITTLFNIANDVYKALESLDNEYIAGIVAAVKSAEIASEQAKTASSKATQASNQALEASSKALEASNKAATAQADIKRTIEALQQTVRILKEFKERTSKDFMTLSLVPDQISAINRKLQSLEQSNKSISRIAQNFQNASSIINGTNHFGDIDAIWNDVEGHKTNIEGLHKQVDDFVTKVDEAILRIYNDIATLQEYRTKLESYAHLGDIDTIWNDVEGHKTNIEGLHKQIDEFIMETHKVEKSTKSSIEEIKSSQQEQDLEVGKKIKIAYGIAGGSVILSLVQLILQLLGVL